MFTHVVLGANDITRAKTFYDAVMACLGFEGAQLNPEGTAFAFFNGQNAFTITKPIDGNEATFGNGSTIGLMAHEESQVDAFYQQALAQGGACAGEPKTKSTPFGFDIRIAYVRDLTGNKLAVSYIYR